MDSRIVPILDPKFFSEQIYTLPAYTTINFEDYYTLLSRKSSYNIHQIYIVMISDVLPSSQGSAVRVGFSGGEQIMRYAEVFAILYHL